MLSCGNLKMNSVDYVLVVDRVWNIIFNTRYESRVNETAQDSTRVRWVQVFGFTL